MPEVRTVWITFSTWSDSPFHFLCEHERKLGFYGQFWVCYGQQTVLCALASWNVVHQSIGDKNHLSCPY